MAKQNGAEKPKIVTAYVILYRVPEQTGSGWTVLGTDTNKLVNARGAEAAIRKALEQDSELVKMAETGNGIEIAAVPARSWQPAPVRLVKQDPIIKIG